MSLAGTIPPPRSVSPGLYLVATPIGNLRDITLRALDVIAAADLVLAEDTRVTGKLLSAFGLSRPIARYDDHIAEQAWPKISMALHGGAVVAQISDAGTPLVSDPGYRLVRAAIAEGLPVHPIPGASAPLAALTISGLPTDRFLFAGFPPAKSAARRAMFETLASVRATLIFFETAPRLPASLKDMAQVLGAREGAVARELTKLYEECWRGSLSSLAADPRIETVRGEIVVLVGPGEAESATAEDADRALADALKTAGPGEAASQVARALGLPRKALYLRALEMKGGA